MSKLKDTKDLIRELAELLETSSLSEIEVEDEDVRIRVARQAQVHHVSAAPAHPAPAPAAAPVAAAAPAAPSQGPAEHPGAVPSPMVGTVYLAPEPGAPTFVKAGDSVAEGDTLLIVEAMKVMNPIAAPRSGTVTRILVSDAQPIEYGEPLVIIE
ncbi:acetyl-CoA carboxylase, biotin carboxyl carrier protein [Iodidimonas gelatinilytica]|uniref:Biotin carboxyl carrier protein of acetyl-CoA carboxylase n=1 Tax=Iodidimonas gelatinilytica TaxID=1236966 RepID=A0A5A7MKX9_9PROT|nr:acetyl-CoA carboxylase biotin carboxyl carrier protein [Iodidimonas gelatinilytica]GEQ96661.1 acetyl-CoA carboxylase, biotin carboxyl carrier protein [Iodidimonas gelatinilytica]GER01387.1 acetyl-CoA carboxylase, biotin carboxyl carrier protein [Iodidimonas gelatinilytica]